VADVRRIPHRHRHAAVLQPADRADGDLGTDCLRLQLPADPAAVGRLDEHHRHPRQNQALFYNRATGDGATGHVTSSIGATPRFQQDKLYLASFSPGWTEIVGDDDGNMLFAVLPPSNIGAFSPDGTWPAAAGVLRADGTFATTTTQRINRWTHMVAWPSSPHIVFFYNDLTGQASSGYLNTTTHSHVNLVDWR
jgi:hypothetical protein